MVCRALFRRARQLLKRRHRGQAFDLAAKHNVAAVVKTNEVEDVLADIDANHGQVVKVIGLGLLGCCSSIKLV